MPIRPIELLHTNSAAPIKHIEHTKVQQEQVQINKNFQETISHQQKKTVQTNKSEQHEVRYDAKEKGNGQFSNPSKNKHQKRHETPENEVSNTPVIRGGLDIKI